MNHSYLNKLYILQGASFGKFWKKKKNLKWVQALYGGQSKTGIDDENFILHFYTTLEPIINYKFLEKSVENFDKNK